jgi:hypothetical protein
VEMSRSFARLWPLLALLACSEEARPRTELVVVVDTDLTVPDQLDEIVIAAQGPGSISHEAIAALGEDEPRLPRYLTFDHQKGALGPVAVTVSGKLRGETVLIREADVSFVAGRTLVLPLHLARRCVDVSCERSESCTESGCAPSAIDEASLEEWSGDKPILMSEPELDAGGPEFDAATPGDAAAPSDAGRDGGTDAGRDGGADAAQCVPQLETCNRRDDDCDGRVDENFDLTRDSNNCGMCGVRCVNGQSCANSRCR